MASETSVVTPERFATGLTSFEAWMEAIEERKDEFQSHYDEYTPDAADIAAMKKLVEEHGVKVLTIGEHWCPDVWRGLPVMARIAEATGMEHRIFFRDQNKDIMSEFLLNGEFESIPTVVFYDRDHNYPRPLDRATRGRERADAGNTPAGDARWRSARGTRARQGDGRIPRGDQQARAGVAARHAKGDAGTAGGEARLATLARPAERDVAALQGRPQSSAGAVASYGAADSSLAPRGR